jgi:hypothetical protein
MSDLGILNPTKEPGRKNSPLAATNVNPFPAEQPGVCRPCARSEHYQTYSESREQKMHAGVPPRPKIIQASMIACKAPATGVHNPAISKLPTPIAMNLA